MRLKKSQCKQDIINQAMMLGFTACRFVSAVPVDDNAVRDYNDWISCGKHDEMHYMERNGDIRNNPELLFEGAHTIICLAINYFPKTFQPHHAPQFAYYAYGNDYHNILRSKLKQLSKFIETEYGAKSRCCVDTAPIRERYWAKRSGLGFIGRNNQLIIPGKGSYFFLCELITTLSIEPDAPCMLSCGDCNRCIEACPTQALSLKGALDARKCLSCLTIEHHGDLPATLNIGNHIYGCDECQKACPHNSHAQPTEIEEFTPSDAFLSLNHETIGAMTQESFNNLFKHSAIKRATLATLQRTLKRLKNSPQ